MKGESHAHPRQVPLFGLSIVIAPQVIFSWRRRVR